MNTRIFSMVLTLLSQSRKTFVDSVVGSHITGAEVTKVVDAWWQGSRGGRDPPRLPQGSGCCRPVLVDMTLRHRVDIRGSTVG